MIFGILLAAGESRLMGKLKQLLPFGDSTVIETTIDNLLGADLDEVIVVLGHEAEIIIASIQHKPIKMLYNADYKQGMLSSVQCGVRAVEETVICNGVSAASRNGFLIALVDQPFITTEIINCVIAAFYQTDKGIVLPSFNRRRGHPVIFDMKYTSEILSLPDDSEGLRKIIYRHQDDIHYVEIDTDAIIRDMDYWEDYVGMRNAECGMRN